MRESQQHWDMSPNPGFFKIKGGSLVHEKGWHVGNVPVAPSRTDRTAAAKPSSPSPNPPSLRRDGGQVPDWRTRSNRAVSEAVMTERVVLVGPD